MSTVERKDQQTKPDFRDVAVQKYPDCQEVAVQTCSEITTVESTGRQITTFTFSWIIRTHANCTIVKALHAWQTLIVKLSPDSICIHVILQIPFVEWRSWVKQSSEC